MKVDEGEAVTWHPPHALEELGWLLDALTEVTGQIGKNLVHGGSEAGPYR